MNEDKDILFASAKLASLNNPWASIATHAVSSAYNAAMIGKYRYELSLAMAGVASYSVEQVQSFRRDLIKHSVLEAMDALGLFLCAVTKK